MNRDYLEENALLTSQVTQMTKNYEALKKELEAETSPSIIVRRNPVTPHFRLGSFPAEAVEESLQEDSVDVSLACGLKDQISELKGLFSVQEDTLQKFQAALEENKLKNQELVSLISDIKEEKSTQIKMLSSRCPNSQADAHNPPGISEFMSSLMSFDRTSERETKRSLDSSDVAEPSPKHPLLFLSFVPAIKI